MKNFPDPLEYENNDSESSMQNNEDGHFTFRNYDKSDFEGSDESVVDDQSEISKQQDEEIMNADEQEKEKEKESNDENKSGPHVGKYLVVQKGKACCDKGAKFPNFKVNSHKKHYWNDESGEADYLAVTEDDLTFNPPVMPFGTCSIKNGNPCAFAPSGKWTKTYNKIKIMGKKPLTEMSELMCAVGGKIIVMTHGQQSEAGKSNVNNADPKEQQIYNPVLDYEEFTEEINLSDEPHAW